MPLSAFKEVVVLELTVRVAATLCLGDLERSITTNSLLTGSLAALSARRSI